jgi:agmatine/peptidylarginine deiminase
MNAVYLSRIFAMLCCIGCKTAAPHSESKGHFENATAEDLQRTTGQQTAKPEYTPYRTIMVSTDLLFRYDHMELFLTLLRSDVSEVMVAIPPGFPADTEQFLNYLTQTQDITLPDDMPQLREKIRFVKRREREGQSVWIRDYAPFTTLSTAGDIRLLDFNYMTRRVSDDLIPQDLSAQTGYVRISMPLYLEGGNFMVNESRHCMTTEKIVADNAEVRVEGDRVYDREEIIALLKEQAGCEKVTIFPRMPHESTGHIDMWAKFIDDETILVSRMLPETVTSMPTDRYPFAQTTTDIRDYLEARIAELRDMGYQLIELPLPLPDSGSGLIVRTYVNGLIVGGKLLVPRYESNTIEFLGATPYVDDDLIPMYEEKVMDALNQTSLEPIWVNADAIIQGGGSIHCATMEMGKQ